MPDATILIALPAWVDTRRDEVFGDAEARMAHLLELGKRNVREAGGGPFAAGVFELATGRLIAAAVNTVVPSSCSVAHAEMNALMLAQARAGGPRLSTVCACSLYTTAQPCSMCYGALPWAGLDELACGANREDVQSLSGFDEGPLPSDWRAELEKRGIRVREGVLRDACRELLREYWQGGGTLY